MFTPFIYDKNIFTLYLQRVNNTKSCKKSLVSLSLYEICLVGFLIFILIYIDLCLVNEFLNFERKMLNSISSLSVLCLIKQSWEVGSKQTVLEF